MAGNGRAALNIQNTNESYFFHNTQYVKIQWTPGTTRNESITHGPASINKEWNALHEAGFKQVDAALQLENNMAYMFCGKKYCRVRGMNELVGSVRNITDGWPSLKEAKFDVIDAAVRTPGHPNQAYLFCRDMYVRIEYEPGTMNDRIVDGPRSIKEGWPNMSFKEIDMALPRPDNDQQGIYFFSGSHYVQLQVDVGGSDDKVISGERKVADYWPALKKSGFY